MKKIMKTIPLLVLAALSTTFLLGTTNVAFADASTLGDVLCNAANNTSPFLKIFSYVAYAAGALMTVMGIHHFRLHADSPSNNPAHRPTMLWVGAAMLLALPGTIKAVILSIYATSTGSGSFSCSSGAMGTGGAGLDGMLSGFVSNITGPMLSFVSIIAIASGLFMMVRGLMKAGKYGYDPKANSIHQILTHLGFGALLFTIGDNLKMMMGSVFGTSTIPTINAASAASSVMGWGFVASLGGGSQQFATAVGAALTFIQIIGVIAFVRGWMVLKNVTEGGGQTTLAQGVTHIVGGVLAINIPAFLKIMDTTFGTNLL